jgi:cell division protein FtsL
VSAATAPRRQRPLASPPRPRRDRSRRHLRVVQEGPRRHPVLFLGLYLVVATLVVLAAVSLNALAAGGAVDARELAEQVTVAEREHGLLVAEVASLEDPARIRQAATEAGLVPADDPRFLEPGRTLPSDTAPRAPSDDELKPLLSADGR